MRQFLIFLFFVGTVPVVGQPTKLCTFNIRFENPKDGIHQWENRKESAVNFIKIEQIDMIGMQEVLHSQIQYLEENLPDYQRVGVGRDDGKTQGEYSPIFFRKNKYQLLDSGTFWLSTDRTQPNKGWDAALPRVCTWVKLLNKEDQDTLLLLNTHFDHVGVQARIKSVDVMVEVINEMNHHGKTVLMGDFNLEPEKEPVQKVIAAGFTDSYDAPIKLGPKGTYNAFQVGKKYERRIDYIFLKGASPKTYKVNSMLINETFLSDHFPVIVELN
ncbi:endonuclease [Marivirga lumbricoides]|uniref:Endonuclease n=1 Tax=Marivirga lumbricoides TaxID=1046115 RepID=A0A2T4DV50_9BACT|nr:endonuclease [Marivirga lumbricoides]